MPATPSHETNLVALVALSPTCEFFAQVIRPKADTAPSDKRDVGNSLAWVIDDFRHRSGDPVGAPKLGVTGHQGAKDIVRRALAKALACALNLRASLGPYQRDTLGRDALDHRRPLVAYVRPMPCAYVKLEVMRTLTACMNPSARTLTCRLIFSGAR